MDDGAEGLWRVHDKLYDFTIFMKTHPGGEEWLELTKGTDITEAFESHHLSPTTEKLLNKFYMRNAQTSRNSPFTFKEDGFYRTLKKAVYEELKKIPKNTSKIADKITDGIFISLLCSSALAVWVRNYWSAMIFYIIASVCLGILTVACHNYIHRKPNWRMYLFNLSIWSYRFLLIFFRQGFFKQHYRWHDAIGLLLPLWMWYISGESFTRVFYVWIWINCTGSLLFYSIGSNAAHHHPDTIKYGDEPKSETPDWAVHQLEAVLDRRDVNSNIFTVMTLFGDHALHHLFPTLDHSLLKHLYPVFLEMCNKYQAKYRVSTQFKMVVGQLKDVTRTKYRTVDDRYKMWGGN